MCQAISCAWAGCRLSRSAKSRRAKGCRSSQSGERNPQDEETFHVLADAAISSVMSVSPATAWTWLREPTADRHHNQTFGIAISYARRLHSLAIRVGPEE